MKKILILGATSAVVQPVIERLLNSGAQLALAARNTANLKMKSQHIHSFHLDVEDTGSHQVFFENVIAKMGSIDEILVAYGLMQEQQISESDWKQFFHEQMVNYLSVTSILMPFVNYFEKRMQGSIAVITSVAGDRMRRSNYVYGLSKGCLSLYLQAIRTRLEPIGVKVVDIKLGLVRSPMTQKMLTHPLLSEPENVADRIVKSMNCGCPVVYIPGYWRYIMMILKIIPSFIFYRLKI